MSTRHRQGSRQQQNRQRPSTERYWFLGLQLKGQTLRDLTIILALVLLVVVMGTEASKTRPIKIVDPRAMTAYAMDLRPPRQEPELAPLSERERNIQIIKKVWRQDWKMGVAIARCESGLRADAFNGANTNGTWDAGLFQINSIHGIAKETLFEPFANAGYAFALYQEQGLSPWNSSRHCWEEDL